MTPPHNVEPDRSNDELSCLDTSIEEVFERHASNSMDETNCGSEYRDTSKDSVDTDSFSDVSTPSGVSTPSLRRLYAVSTDVSVDVFVSINKIILLFISFCANIIILYNS